MLIVLTNNFPYGRGEDFLTAELPHLCRAFERVVVVPMNALGQPRDVLPPNAEVELGLARTAEGHSLGKIRQAAKSLSHAGTYREYLESWQRHRGHPAALKRLLIQVGHGLRVYHWLKDYLPLRQIHGPTLLYSYWLGSQTLGAVLARGELRGLHVISRCHGGDVYLERHRPPYVALQGSLVRSVDRLYCVSDDGARYLKRLYPSLACEVRRLGVPGTSLVTSPSADGTFRVVTCSHLNPVKRIHLIISGLHAFAVRNPLIRVDWHHLGDGALRKVLEEQSASLPSSVSARFMGHLPNPRVYDFYGNHPVDVFVNLSASEGIPVSIMEAMSCGIPVIATAVGGNPEIVNEGNGLLLPPVPAISDVVSALELFASLTDDEARSRRSSARSTWKTSFDSAANYASFAAELATLATSA